VNAAPSHSLPAGEALLVSPMAQWLQAEKTDRPNVYRLRFAEHHIGNPFVRALHGGVVGSMLELAAQLEIARLKDGARSELVSSATDYFRVTKDADLFARVDVVRIARRLAFVDVWCWQDSEDIPVTRGSCTLRLFAEDG
jgi:acyl-coenzyme A thioesterase PaaI-like protein